MTAAPAFGLQQRDARVARGAFLLVALYVLLYVLPLPVRPLASPDEVRYAEIAREMLVSGDWVSPHFNGVRYFEKPALGHWLNAVSLAVFGESTFAVRLPVALATGLAALIVFGFARRFAGARVAALSTLIFLTTFLVAGVGTFALLDAFLALFLTAALAAYYIALREVGVRRRNWLVVCGVACGAAFLVKGFLALAIPVIVAAPYLVVTRRWRDLFVTPWWPIVVAAVVALPWSVLIHLREPDFWRYFFWVEHVQRFTADDAQHAEPVWYYAAYLPLLGWPWILLLPAAAVGLRRPGGEDRDFIRYLMIAALLPLLFFSVSRGKLATYILPCFAPLSILLAAGIERYLAAGHARAWRFAGGVVLLAFVSALLLLAAAQSGAFAAPLFWQGEGTRRLVFAGALAAGALGGGVAAAAAGRWTRIAGIAAAGVALVVPLQIALPGQALVNFAPGGIVARLAGGSADAVIVSDAPLFGTAAWVLKRTDIYVASPGEIDYGLSYPEARHRLLDAQAFAALLEANRGLHEVVLVCVPSTEDDLKAQLPPNARREQQGSVVVWRVPES
jgi:4-amino-4-deoxy-L-arabinose transferase